MVDTDDTRRVTDDRRRTTPRVWHKLPTDEPIKTNKTALEKAHLKGTTLRCAPDANPD